MTISTEIPSKHLEILNLIKQGLTTKEISSRVFVTERNIKRIKSIYFTEFNCLNSTQLIARLIELNIL